MSATTIGIFLALGALFSWGAGDFLIQQSSRKVGVNRTLFINGIIGLIILTPFILRGDLSVFYNPKSLLILAGTGLLMVIAALVDFEALREGKISVIEPVYALELPLTVGLGIFLAGEHLGWGIYGLIGLIFIGTVMTGTVHKFQLHYHRRIFEKGVFLAILAAVLMSFANYYVAIGSRETSALLALWFVNAAIVVLCGIILLAKGDYKGMVKAVGKHKGVALGQGVVDNLAWVFYASSMTFIPIGIATAISESYIAIAAMLGLAVNKEKLKKHQFLGIVITVGGIIFLAKLIE